MDSDDDTYDADCYDDIEVSVEEDDTYDGDCYDDIEVSKGKNCVILNQDYIRQRQEEDITEVSTLLSVSRASACILLLHYKWNVTAVNESWFSDEEKVRMTVGLLKKPMTTTDCDNSPNPKKKLKSTACGICFDDYPQSKLYDAGCDHLFCCSCWEGYVTTSIHDGSGCLTLRCPQLKCGAAVDQDMVNTFVSQEDKDKYSNYLFKSYVEDNTSIKIKWCPAPGCDYAVNFIGDSENYDVSCNCAFGFCWNCTQEVHSPVDCDTVSNWVMKNKDESENVNWILVNSKPCPGCKKPIQKNQGCNHMTCKCGFQFCWLCLCSIKNHYSCNGFEARRSMDDESEKRKQMAKKLLDKYTHYYERWEANQKSMGKAKEDLQRTIAVYIPRLTINQRKLERELQFIIDAWKQIIECRRVLKWTYAYGYYFPEHEHTKRQFFEYLQGEAESGLERLHHCAEKDLEVYLKAEGPSQNFMKFHTKLVDLTIVTGKYFEKLVKALQGGLADVDSLGSTSSTGLADIVGSLGSTSSKAGKSGRGKGTSSKSRSAGLDLGVQELWSCEYCTYTNEESASICKMCNKHKASWSCEHCTYVNNKSGMVCYMCNKQQST